MSVLRKAARDIGIVAVSYLVMWCATLAFTVAQARYLGPARFGELSLALSYAAFLTFAIDFGLSAQLSRIVAQRSAGHEDALANTMVARAALWLAVTPGILLATVLLGYDRELQQTIVVLAISVLMVGVCTTIGAYLQGREEFLLPSVASIAQRFVAAGIGLLMLALGADLTAVAAAFVIGAAANLSLLLIHMRGRTVAAVRIEPRETWSLLRSAIPLGAWFLAAAFYGNVGILILERIATAESVGWYAAAFRLFGAAAMFPAIVAGMVLYPVFSRLAVDSRAELRAVIDKALTLLTLSGVGVGLVLAACAESIVSTLYATASYAEAASALRILGLGLPFLYVNAVLIFALFGLHRERRLLIVAAVAATLNPIANVLAIPLFAEDGAASIMSLTELVLLLWLVRATPRDLLSGESLRVAAKAGLAAIVAALLVSGLGDRSLAVIAPAILIAYGALVLALRTVAPEDLRALGVVLRLRRRAAPVLAPAPAITEEVA